MGKVNLYYLIARNKKDNSFCVVPFNGCDCNKLEDIDLFTMNYKNELELSNELLSMGLIDSIPVDLFIVNQDKGQIFTQEVIYSYAREIESIAKNSKDNRISDSRNDIDTILTGFAEKMHNDKKFNSMISYTDTNIYKKYVDYFIDHDEEDRVLYEAMYKNGSYAMKSYKLIRNIVEAINRYNNDYRFTSHNINRNEFYRRLLSDSLIAITDRNYISNQLSLLDDADTDIEDDIKAIEALSVFDRIPRSDFIVDDGNVFIDKSKFDDCDINEIEKLDNLLGEYLMTLVYKLARANDTFRMEEADIFRNQILDFLKNNKIAIEIAYQWCMTYCKVKKVYGDVDGFQYKKD